MSQQAEVRTGRFSVSSALGRQKLLPELPGRVPSHTAIVTPVSGTGHTNRVSTSVAPGGPAPLGLSLTRSPSLSPRVGAGQPAWGQPRRSPAPPGSPLRALGPRAALGVPRSSRPERGSIAESEPSRPAAFLLPAAAAALRIARRPRAGSFPGRPPPSLPAAPRCGARRAQVRRRQRATEGEGSRFSRPRPGPLPAPQRESAHCLPGHTDLGPGAAPGSGRPRCFLLSQARGRGQGREMPAELGRTSPRAAFSWGVTSAKHPQGGLLAPRNRQAAPALGSPILPHLRTDPRHLWHRFINLRVRISCSQV